jgi:hypothetical protein
MGDGNGINFNDFAQDFSGISYKHRSFGWKKG